MPKIYRNENGDLVKEGSNGCTDCGLPSTNKTILNESVEESIASNTKPKAEGKPSTNKQEVTKDDN